MIQWEIFPLTHTLEPFSKPGALRIISVHPHVLSQVEDLDLLPQNRSLQTCSYNILLGAFRNNRESLLKITSKCYSDATKGKVRLVKEISEQQPLWPTYSALQPHPI